VLPGWRCLDDHVFVMRVFWLIMSVLAVIYAISSAWAPVSDVSLGCSKIGEFGGDNNAQCSDPIVEVFGMWRLVVLGVLLSVPPLIAAVSTRRSIWWGAVVALVAVGSTGLFLWTSFWSLLHVAFPLAAVGAVAVAVDAAVRALKRTRSSHL
jgi:hypothetical protein